MSRHPSRKNADVPRITGKPFTWTLHDSWTDCPEMVVIPSGQNIHPSAGADAVLTQAPTIDCHWRLLTLDLQRVQGHRAGSRLLRHTGVQFAAIHIQKLDFNQEQVLACRGGV